MRKQIRKNKDGSQYFSFVYFDKEQGKDVRISRAEIQRRFGRDITTVEDAMTVVNVLDAKYESLKNKIRQRSKWKKRYYNFSKLLDGYSKKQKNLLPIAMKIAFIISGIMFFTTF